MEFDEESKARASAAVQRCIAAADQIVQAGRARMMPGATDDLFVPVMQRLWAEYEQAFVHRLTEAEGLPLRHAELEWCEHRALAFGNSDARRLTDAEDAELERFRSARRAEGAALRLELEAMRARLPAIEAMEALLPKSERPSK